MGMSFLKLIPYIAILGLLIGAFFYIKNLGKEGCESEQKTVVITATNYREQVEHEGKHLNRSELIAELFDGGWLRND